MPLIEAGSAMSNIDMEPGRTEEGLCNFFRIRRHSSNRPECLEKVSDQKVSYKMFNTYNVELGDQD